MAIQMAIAKVPLITIGASLWDGTPPLTDLEVWVMVSAHGLRSGQAFTFLTIHSIALAMATTGDGTTLGLILIFIHHGAAAIG
jgi:hypothetical protein